jgi:hypothetical protein
MHLPRRCSLRDKKRDSKETQQGGVLEAAQKQVLSTRSRRSRRRVCVGRGASVLPEWQGEASASSHRARARARAIFCV